MDKDRQGPSAGEIRDELLARVDGGVESDRLAKDFFSTRAVPPGHPDSRAGRVEDLNIPGFLRRDEGAEVARKERAEVGASMGRANDRQVGGDHYRGRGIMHWDWVASNGHDYFQGQISKYLDRWKMKYAGNPARMYEDLLKGFHIYQKYLEVWEYYMPKPVVQEDRLTFSSNELAEAERILRNLQVHWEWVGGHGSRPGREIFRCKECRTEVHAISMAHAEMKHPNCRGGKTVG